MQTIFMKNKELVEGGGIIALLGEIVDVCIMYVFSRYSQIFEINFLAQTLTLPDLSLLLSTSCLGGGVQWTPPTNS